ncbi:MAG: protein-L-isoaspartate(D-aspartate) O-methyltransferase [bacterium]
MGAELNDTDFANLRHRMVEDQLRSRGVTDERVLAAMGRVPRHLFVPPAQRWSAYHDGPLPIGLGQTISQPYMVARMTELLHLVSDSRVLEIGTGSGYQAAVLAELAGGVWTIERHADLARRAEELLLQLGYANVRVITGDGTLGFPEAAPYDGILVTAAAPYVPESLREQLAVNGRMVIPVEAGYAQDLKLIERLPDEGAPSLPAAGAARAPAAMGPGGTTQAASNSAPESAPEPSPRYRETSILGCVFVPLIGEQGYRQ